MFIFFARKAACRALDLASLRAADLNIYLPRPALIQMVSGRLGLFFFLVSEHATQDLTHV